jgi:hypothetical protein
MQLLLLSTGIAENRFGLVMQAFAGFFKAVRDRPVAVYAICARMRSVASQPPQE